MIRIADVHHHLSARPVLLADNTPLDCEVDQSIVDTPASTFSTTNSDVHSRLQHLRGVARADDAWQSQLAAHNRAMTGSAAAVGNDRSRLFHDRLPRRIGH